MGSDRRFQYALQPMLLTRQWELDRLRSELGEVNAAWAVQDTSVKALLQRQQASMQEWGGLEGTPRPLSVDRFVMLARYIEDCGAQARRAQEALDALTQRRDDLTERLHLAHRALDAVHEHREKMQVRFLQDRISLVFKAADDQWGMSRTTEAAHDSES
ncbi:hypothetical protein IGS59_25475 [Janthinobacterium sp. GW460P]|uniref:hypothetical protein n=1 Tax=unclassified Janthinobacterium TaxID=2610881 RepID=UPI000A31FC07|nr:MULTISPECIES: hypothetical protein [unclassified Janthinobacterium]MCC7705597.1 hypothetical protein [Janthinobacterium sp. GW460P]MCC7711099.1 hypothetical protein [Janthinobacterium sp. GW460W]